MVYVENITEWKCSNRIKLEKHRAKAVFRNLLEFSLKTRIFQIFARYEYHFHDDGLFGWGLVNVIEVNSAKNSGKEKFSNSYGYHSLNSTGKKYRSSHPNVIHVPNPIA